MRSRPGWLAGAALAVLLLAVAATSTAATGASSHHRYHLTATLEPQLVVPRPAGTRPDAAGTFSAKLNLAWHGGAAIWPYLTFTGVSSAVTAVHIHAGAPGKRGPALYTICVARGSDMVSGCRSPVAFFNWWAGRLLPLDPATSGPLYVDVHTRLNPRGELRGQVEATPFGRMP
jgi:hypothetical protein